MVPRRGPKNTDFRGAQKNNSHTISYKTFQPTEQVANFVIPLCSSRYHRLKSARRTRSSFIVLRTSRPFPAATFRGRVLLRLLRYFLFRCCYLQKLIDANVSTFVRPDLDKEVTKMADKADSRAPFHLILEGLRCTSPTSLLDSTRRDLAHILAHQRRFNCCLLLHAARSSSLCFLVIK